MKEATSRQLYAYWNEVRGGRLAPRRFDIEPSCIASILPDTFILERASDNRFRFRVCGSRVIDFFGRELRGVDLMQLWSVDDRRRIERILTVVTEDGAAGLVSFEATTVSGAKGSLEIILLPLVHAGTGISRVLGAMGGSQLPQAFGVEAIDSLRLESTDMVWPDGRPHAVASRMDRQSPISHTLADEGSTVRVVTQSRRAFRVYEGGLSDKAQSRDKEI